MADRYREAMTGDAGAFWAKIPAKGESVSYTHLDVYKRQPFDRSKRPPQLIQRDLHLAEIKGDDHARPVMDRDVLVDRQDVGIHLGEAVERFAEDAFFMMQHQ